MVTSFGKTGKSNANAESRVATEHHVDVLVVGGGPAGMTAAGDLARGGHSVAVLERWPAINPSSRAFATMARTLEVLDSRGLADDLLAGGHTAGEVGLFAGARLDLTHLPSRYPFVLITPQTNVDQALAGYAVAHGADVHRGVEVTALTQDATGVTVTARPKGDDDPGHRTTWRASYVVGADGAHSTVRDLLGLECPGPPKLLGRPRFPPRPARRRRQHLLSPEPTRQQVLSSVVLADVKLAAGPTDQGLTLGSTRDVFGFLVPYGRADGDGAWYRSMTWDRAHQVPDREPVADHEIADVLHRAMGRDVGVREVGWRSRFHCEERQVTRYRTGRVFLAGDAAHVHSPMGGQGMNTGIQDAANLAWKLSAVLGGAAGEILDTYQAERHPVGRLVLRQSGLMTRAVTLHPRPARWLRDRLAPRLLARAPVRDAVAGRFAGTGLRYPRGRDEHPLVGTRATEVPLAEGRLTELQRQPGFVLVCARGERSHPPVTRPVTVAWRTDAGPALLVRPDGYIAWAGPAAADPSWRPVLARWTGDQAVPART
jgi:2-polyprenyl-6-methoxyphenol hydroxylase-like FAD-dependent oxidoreductase